MKSRKGIFLVYLTAALKRGSFLSIACILASQSLLLSCTHRIKEESLNTLHVAVEEKIKGLDPIYAVDLYSGIQVSQVYETPLRYHYLKRPYTLTPNLLETMPELSKNRRVYTLTLKKGVLFQDDPCFRETGGKGRELTAEDLVYSIQRLADPRNASPGWWVLDGKILGLNAWREKGLASSSSKGEESGPTSGSESRSQPGPGSDWGAVEGLKVLDRYKAQITLTRPSHQFLDILAMPVLSIVPREAVEYYGKEFLNHPVGTGPYRLVEYNPNAKLIWVRNPTYRTELYPSEGSTEDKNAGLLEDAGKPLPLTDKVVVDVLVERQPMWLNFLAGKLDLSTIPKDSFSSAISKGELSEDLKKKKIQLTKFPAVDVTHITFNLSDPIIGKNRFLRQAMSLAYDQAVYIDLFFNGRAISAQGPIPPGLAGFDPKFKNPYRQFNIIKAKELIAKAGYPEGKGLPVFEYASLADSTGRQSGEYFQKMMAAIGVRVRISSYSWPQFLEVVRGRRAQIWAQAWAADYPDGENFLQLFYSKNVSPGPNDSGYTNPVFDRLYEKSLMLSDGAERTNIYAKLINILTEDCPWIFVSHRLSYVVTHPWLKNYKPSDFDHSRYQYYRIDPALKK